ncbi:hypothetical protein RJ639_005370, partial [Escallonia herrerae]
STFGAVLDMVTDRISTASLLVILSQVYSACLILLNNIFWAWLGFLVIACFRYCQPLVANVQYFLGWQS